MHDTSLMRSLGGNRTWYQRRLLDVYLVIGLAAVSVTFVCGILSIKLPSFCFKIQQKVDQFFNRPVLIHLYHEVRINYGCLSLHGRNKTPHIPIFLYSILGANKQKKQKNNYLLSYIGLIHRLNNKSTFSFKTCKNVDFFRT